MLGRATQCALAVVSSLSVMSLARAELAPDEVAIIAMAASPQSKYLAEYYAHARKIPRDRIYLLSLGKPAQTMSRDVWETQARPAIRSWLIHQGLATRVRCLVTCWDVPLLVDARRADSPIAVERKAYLAEARHSRLQQIAALLKVLESIGPAEAVPRSLPLAANTPLGELASRIEGAMKGARQRLPSVAAEAQRRQASMMIERAFVATFGLRGLAQVAGREGLSTRLKPETSERLENLRGQIQGLAEGLQALSSLPDSVTRDVQILGMIQKTGGLMGAVRWVDQQQELLQRNETVATLDSELSLLFWPDYPLFRWQPNLLHYQFESLRADRPAVLMVARIEAPTLDLAKRIIDTAIATEKTGLAGKFYLDARGMSYDPKRDKMGSYGQYDQSIRDLAERLKKHTKLEVVLDNEAKLYSRGQCPDAALYCGWYSLGKYVDAFAWKPGAVGYHIASMEAATIRDPGSEVWCNAMLQHGVCATLGPAFEPYLVAFPLPDDFFSLLLTGRHTLAEVYYRTAPCSSWAMVLVGDPLYNPFKNRPALAEDHLPERMRLRADNGPSRPSIMDEEDH